MGNKNNKEINKSSFTDDKSNKDRFRDAFQKSPSTYSNIKYQKMQNLPDLPPKIPPRYENVFVPPLPERTHPNQKNLIDLK